MKEVVCEAQNCPILSPQVKANISELEKSKGKQQDALLPLMRNTSSSSLIKKLGFECPSQFILSFRQMRLNLSPLPSGIHQINIY